MNKKPTGKTGFIRIGPTGVNYHQTIFPETKEDIEKFIIERFVNNLNQQNTFFQIKQFQKKIENDFDFVLDTSLGKRDMDLMEIAPKDFLNKGYSEIPNHYLDTDLGKKVWDKIEEKSNHYGNKKQKLFLLIYSTDFRLNLSELCIQYLKYLSNKNEHCFEMIFYFSLLTSEEGFGRLIYPTDVYKFDEDKHKNDAVFSLL